MTKPKPSGGSGKKVDKPKLIRDLEQTHRDPSRYTIDERIKVVTGAVLWLVETVMKK